MNDATIERVIEEMRAMLDDASDLLSATATAVDWRVARARAKVKRSATKARRTLERSRRRTARHMRTKGRDADRYVRENPWPVIGLAAGIGLAIGYLLGRR
jgi:ElaB/YqjD/DUF883 family membrane-anchored ribosome-binding protein